MTWLLGVRIVIIALALVRFARDVAAVRRKSIPIKRLFLPLVILLAAALVANRLIPRAIGAAGLFCIDVAFLALCFSMAASLRSSAPHLRFTEERLQHVLERFFPPLFARWTSIELTVLRHSYTGVKAFVAPPKPTYGSYVNGSPVGLIGMLLVLGVVPDAFLRWVFLPSLAWPLALLIGALELWASLWIFGLYGTMAARPHEIASDGVVLHNGVLGSVRLHPHEITGVRVLETTKRRHLPRRRGDGSRVLALGGVPIVEIALENGQNVFVASDAPYELRALLAASTASG